MEFTEKELKELKLDPMVVWSGDEPITKINKRLIDSQGVGEDGFNEIKEFHIARHDLFKSMEGMNLEDKSMIKRCVNLYEQIEYNLQDAWLFGKDATHHLWYEIPHCTCPKMDNGELRGIDRKIIDNCCPMHGGLEIKETPELEYVDPKFKETDIQSPVDFGGWLLKFCMPSFNESGLSWRYEGKHMNTEELFEEFKSNPNGL